MPTAKSPEKSALLEAVQLLAGAVRSATCASGILLCAPIHSRNLPRAVVSLGHQPCMTGLYGADR
ncbi:hypothetical protein ACFRAO_27900 [Streptomyces sp. NPDC056656]|uniref:hypothetical protein n=1 Tax=Streptomyces sp. NPDC056656 TaxID=3345895 RepID=UPI0036A0D45F